MLIILFAARFGAMAAETPAVSLYPNPASTVVSIAFSEPVHADIHVVISDILGNKIETYTFKPGDSVLIDLSALKLPNGMYVLKISSGKTSVMKRLSVKNS